ncbi:MAG: shikimate dehydrogenase [Oscillospiraceae bacterium]|nr:shikimate dehydrogenase [Oscillospiraceae bacterium]
MSAFELAVIGSPVAHSLSPRIHSAFAAALGIDANYTAIEVTREELADFVPRARAELAGFNVTMPLKEAIIPYLDDVQGVAAQCKAVNTVVNDNGKLIGFNTDGEGLLLSLEPQLSTVNCQPAIVLGVGGAAKAVCAALAGAGAEVIALSRRAELPALTGARVLDWSELSRFAPNADLIVNATPLGMEGKPDFDDLGFVRLAKPTAVVYDLVYLPRETSLLRAAGGRGLAVKRGVDLLAWQAAAAFSRFTSVAVPHSVVRLLLQSL